MAGKEKTQKRERREHFWDRREEKKGRDEEKGLIGREGREEREEMWS